VGPVIDVTINGSPAHLVRLAARDAADNGWYLQGQFAGGQAFAAQVTYTP
jgi:hypothetical protein